MNNSIDGINQAGFSQFFALVHEEKKLQKELKSLKTTHEIISLAKNYNCYLDAEEFEQGIRKVANQVSKYSVKTAPIKGVYFANIKRMSELDKYRVFKENFLGSEYLKSIGIK